MPTLWTILTALSAIKSLAGYVDAFAESVVLWYVQKQTSETLGKIADAAALASRAQTDDERYAAAAKWQAALSRPRVSSS